MAAERREHFNLQAKQKGLVGHRTNWQKGYDFPVDANIIWELVRQGKISDDNSCWEFVHARDRSARQVADLRLSAAMQHSERQESCVRQALAAWTPRPFKPATMEEKLFLCQFEWKYANEPGWALTAAARAVAEKARAPGELQLPRRCRFLVYSCPTMVGKTERATHWFGQEETLVLNVHAVTSPCLEEIHTGRWRAVVYDEGDWRLPSACRLLFQSSPRPVPMEPTPSYPAGYSVVMHCMPQIICSKDFWKGILGKEKQTGERKYQKGEWILGYLRHPDKYACTRGRCAVYSYETVRPVDALLELASARTDWL